MEELAKHSVAPIIVTLAFQDADQAFFDAQREQYFPTARNYLKAHLTLFHHLPPIDVIPEGLLASFAERAPFELQVTGLHHTGRGVAYKLESSLLQIMHAKMQQALAGCLIPQDKQKLWPHITIQNKVSSSEAKLLYEKLQPFFRPFKVKAVGLKLWLYLDGPWKHITAFDFNQ